MKLPELHTVPKIVEKARSKAAFDVVTQLVFNAVDGRSTIADIGNRCGLEPALVQRIILRILESGLITVDGFDPESKDKGREGQAENRGDLEGDMDRLRAMPDTTILYDLLDLKPDVARSDLRNRYFGLSKRFHPDRLPAGSSPELKRKAEIAFRRLTAAYNVLSNSRSREEYDQSIADHIELWKIEKELRAAIGANRSGAGGSGSTPPAVRRSDPPKPEPVARPSEKKPPAVIPVRPTTKPDMKARPRVSRPSPARPKPEEVESDSYPPRADYDARRRAYKKERAGKAIQDFFNRPSSVPPPPAGTGAKSGPPAAPKAAGKTPLKPALRPGASKAPAFDPRKTVPHLRDAEIALERNEFAEAIGFLERTLSYAPYDTKALHMLELAKAGQARARIQEQLVGAKKEQRRGNWEEALKLFRKVVVLDPKNLEAKHLLCDLMIEKRQDLPAVLAMAREVVDKGGDKARYFATLGEIYLLAEDFAHAEEAFLKALEKEPQNKHYKKQLKACKR